MTTEERTRLIIEGAFKIAAAQVGNNAGILTTAQVSLWVSMSEAIVKESEARAGENRRKAEAEAKVPPPASISAHKAPPSPPLSTPGDMPNFDELTEPA